jgi:hypothetical protein
MRSPLITSVTTLFLTFLCTNAFGQSTSGPSPATGNIVHESESSTLVDAPEPQGARAGFWTFGAPDAPAPLRTNREAFRDKTWLAAQTVWLGAIVYDSELTHEGLAHHRCVEGNSDLGPHPSRRAIYLSDLPEYAVGTAFNWLVLRYVGKPLIFEFPSYGTVQHVRGGSAWLSNCW